MKSQARTKTSKVRQRGRSRLKRRRQLSGFLFVLPCLLFVSVFFVLPLLMTGWMSLHDWPLLGTPILLRAGKLPVAHAGSAVLAEPLVYNEIHPSRNATHLRTGFSVRIYCKKRLSGVAFFRTVYFLPVVIGLGTSSLLWVWAT